MTSDIFPVLYALHDEIYLSLSPFLPFYTGIDMVSKSWLHVWKGFAPPGTLVVTRSAVCSFGAFWKQLRRRCVFQRLGCDWLPGYQRPRESTLPFWFCLWEGREGGCSWCIEVTLTLTGVMMPACMLLGYFFAFVLRRKNYFWNPRINLLWPFKGILPF